MFSKTISLAVLAGAVAVLSGCANKSTTPRAENFEATVQPKVRSVGHWDLLSRDVVAQTLGTLEKAGIDPNSQLHVALPPNPSEFDLAFRDFLITKLVQTGAGVQQMPNPALFEVTYHTQVVHQNNEMILTTTVARGGQYVARKTDVYYLENVDVPLFMRNAYRNVNMKVVAQ